MEAEYLSQNMNLFFAAMSRKKNEKDPKLRLWVSAAAHSQDRPLFILKWVG